MSDTPETDAFFYRNGYPIEVDNQKAERLCERLERERDQWREFAEGLVRCVRGEEKLRPLLFSADFKKALAEFDRLQEESK